MTTGLLDTSVVIDWDDPSVQRALPDEIAVSAVTLAAVASTGRTHRSRMADLLIAAIAHANGLELYTRNPGDFVGLEELIHVITV